MSVGRGYGPVVVALGTHQPSSLHSFAGKRIGVPGLRTTAYLVLRLLLPDFEPVVVPIAPYARAFEELRSGAIDAALLIHEGRLFYEREGTRKVVDLGEGWAALTGGLPLPLGGNAIRRALGPELVAKVSRVCRSSIHWAADHADEVTQALLAAETRTDVGLDRASLDRYLAMYANADTQEAAPDVRRAIVGVPPELLPVAFVFVQTRVPAPALRVTTMLLAPETHVPICWPFEMTFPSLWML
jgi:1,4-dihydroxy-6-naphthoate synthase